MVQGDLTLHSGAGLVLLGEAQDGGAVIGQVSSSGPSCCPDGYGAHSTT